MCAPTIARTDGARLTGVLGSSPERGQQLAGHYAGARAYMTLADLTGDDAVEAV